MNLNPIKQVYKFNQQAGLLEKGYSDERECAFPIEEALEGFNTAELIYQLGCDTAASPKEISRDILNLTINDIELSDVDRLDKHLDIIVFSLGSIYKLGLNPQETMRALGIVADANMQKLTVGTDSEGKQMKPEGFIPPEEQLQKLLDSVKASR